MNYNQIKSLLRLRLGFSQMIYHPYINIPIIALIVLFIIIWNNIDRFIFSHSISALIHPIFQYSVYTALILSFTVFLFGYIGWVGFITARHDEKCLMKAFTEHERRNGCPVLVYRRKIKGTDVTVRIFYSDIPLKYWLAKMDDIADQMNICFARMPDYGGKNNSNSKLIFMHTTPGRKPADRGILYDEEL